MRVFGYVTAVLFLSVLCSCNHYIDTKPNVVPIYQGSFSFSKYSNLLVYGSNIGLRADKEVMMPRTFKVTVPKGLLWYEMAGSEYFNFYYNKGQVVAINIQLSGDKDGADTSFIPDPLTLDQFIDKQFSDGHGKYSIKRIDRKRRRNVRMIYKGPAIILLYNITRHNYHLFVKDLTGVSFL